MQADGGSERMSRFVSATVPARNDLCCVIARVDPEEAKRTAVGTMHHWRIKKCRLILYTMQEIIASPFPKTECDIYIIANKELYASGKLQKELTLQNLKFSGPKRVTLETHKDCLQFTILHRLAPAWNKVAQCFLKGDFILSTEIITAVKMDLTLYDQAAHFKLWPNRVKLPFVKLEDLCIPEMIINNFMADPDGYIDMKAFGVRRVHVLPSLNKGKVIGISKKIPQTCPFPNYQLLRNHWKNMYGYLLPESEEGMMYYEIHFKTLGQDSFIYPSICVRSSSLIFVHAGDHRATTDQFLRTLTNSASTLCGRPVNFLEEDIKKPNAVDDYPQCTATSAKTVLIEASTSRDDSSSNSIRNLFVPATDSLDQIRKSNHSSGAFNNPRVPTPSLMSALTSTSEIDGKISAKNVKIDNNCRISDSMSTFKKDPQRRVGPEGNNVAETWTHASFRGPLYAENSSHHSQEDDTNETENDKTSDLSQVPKNMKNSLKPPFGNRFDNLPKRNKQNKIKLNNLSQFARDRIPMRIEEARVESPLLVDLTVSNLEGKKNLEYKGKIENAVSGNSSLPVGSTFFSNKMKTNEPISTPEVYRKPWSKIALKIQPSLQDKITIAAVQQKKECIDHFFKSKRTVNCDASKKPLLPALPSSNKRKMAPKASEQKLVQTVINEVQAPVKNKRIAERVNIEDVDIEQMAIDKNLSRVNVDTLRRWLADHFVSYKSRETKIELIAKVVDRLHRDGKLKRP